jgi:hypothetical protein
MNPRADIAKCPGAEKPFCEKCVRKLAPSAGIHQRWTQPIFNPKDECTVFAPLEKYAYLFGGE